MGFFYKLASEAKGNTKRAFKGSKKKKEKGAVGGSYGGKRKSSSEMRVPKVGAASGGFF